MQSIKPIIIPPTTIVNATKNTTTNTSTLTVRADVPASTTAVGTLYWRYSMLLQDGTVWDGECNLTFTGIRQDGSTFHLGTATYTSLPQFANSPTSTDATWTSFNMSSYVGQSISGTNAINVTFSKVTFAINESDPLGGHFRNANAIRIISKLQPVRRTKTKNVGEQDEALLGFINTAQLGSIARTGNLNTDWESSDTYVARWNEAAGVSIVTDIVADPINDNWIGISTRINETTANSGIKFFNLPELINHMNGTATFNDNVTYSDQSYAFSGIRSGASTGTYSSAHESLLLDLNDATNNMLPVIHAGPANFENPDVGIAPATGRISSLTPIIGLTTRDDDTWINTNNLPIFGNGQSLNFSPGGVPITHHAICETWRINDRPCLVSGGFGQFWGLGMIIRENSGTYANASYGNNINSEAASLNNIIPDTYAPSGCGFNIIEETTVGAPGALYGYMFNDTGDPRNLRIYRITHNGGPSYVAPNNDWINFTQQLIIQWDAPLGAATARTRAVPPTTGTFDAIIANGLSTAYFVCDRTDIVNGRAVLYIGDIFGNVIYRLTYDGITPGATDGSNYNFTKLAGTFTNGGTSGAATPALSRNNGIGGTLDFGSGALGAAEAWEAMPRNLRIYGDWLYFCTRNSGLVTRIHKTTGEIQHLLGRTYQNGVGNATVIKY